MRRWILGGAGSSAIDSEEFLKRRFVKKVQKAVKIHLPEGGERVESETRTHVLNAAPLVVGKHRARAHGLNARNLRLRVDQCSELAEMHALGTLLTHRPTRCECVQ